MSSPYLIFLEVALVALALWLHSVLFSLVTFIVLSYFTPKYMYDKTKFQRQQTKMSTDKTSPNGYSHAKRRFFSRTALLLHIY